MSSVYDLVVIGSGPGGYIAAIRAAQLGMKVACVEKHSALGGTCLNVGCIPSKALLESSEHFVFTKNKAAKHGIEVSGLKFNLGPMMERKNQIVKQLTGGIAGLFKKNKIDSLTGTGKLLKTSAGITDIEVTGSDKITVQAKKVILATGSEPIELPFMPFDGKKILSSTEALNLEKIPEHLILVGGGYIGLEMGSVWARLGSKVTVVEFADAILPFADEQIAKELFKSLQKQGLEFKLGTKCLGANISGDKVTVSVEDVKSAVKSEITGDYVLVCTGRKPYSKGLGLENVGVKVNERGFIPVGAHYETSVPGIYAIGDLIGGLMLAHKAEEEGVVAVERMNGIAGHVNYNAIPAVVYTWPELASVGKTEQDLKKEAVAYKVGTFPFMANARARTMDETEGLVKILADAKSDRVLGVHIFGPRASDMIQEAVTVMEFGGSAEDIARTSHGHPTLSEVVKEAALAVDNRKLNL